MSKGSDFFQVGGTLSEDAPSYIERQADLQLLAALERHEFCLVLGPRQMGKSSLMVHAISRLKKQGVRCAVVDFQALGGETDLERWFMDIINQIERTAKLVTNTKEWWKANLHLGPTQRFTAFLEDVLLEQTAGNDVVLFFDEIDSVLNLPFSDEFFTTIRSLFNSRAINPVLRRLSVVLVGVTTPSSFIKDRTRTPFNIGESIALTDFSRDKTGPFQDVLGPGSAQLVDRIFHWTNGQPLMVQKLASVAYFWPPDRRNPSEIDRTVKESYLRMQIEKDSHFKFVQDYLLDAGNVHKTLSTYQNVLLRKDVPNNERSPVQDRLKLAGIVREKNGKLVPRNRIYERVFSVQWVQEHLPVNLQKWIAYGASSALALLLIIWIGQWLIGARTDGSLLGRPLRVGVVSWPGYAGGIVANNGFKPNKDCIFFKNHNQTVEFVLLEDPAQRSQALAKSGEGGVDIVWSTVDYWANELPGFIDNGVKARAIMQVDWSRGGDAIVADESIKRIEDLKGKKISLVKYTPSHWLLEYSLQNSSLSDYDQKEIIDNLVGKDATLDARQAFKDKQVDATVVWEPDVTLAMEREGAHKLVSTETANNLIADVMVAREDFIKEHPDVIDAFVQGWLEGTASALRDPENVVRLLMENEPLYGDMKDPTKVKETLKTVKYADLADNTRMFGLDGSQPLFDIIFKEAAKAWVKRGYIAQAIEPDQARDISFLKRIYEVFPPKIPLQVLPPHNEDVLKRTPISTKRMHIVFPSGSSELDEIAKQQIDRDVGMLVQTNSNAYIRIEGNTDNPGSRESNRQLSEQRAQAVAEYLSQHYGLNENRFIVIGNGPDKPIDTNATPEGRANNRRIDIGIVPVN